MRAIPPTVLAVLALAGCPQSPPETATSPPASVPEPEPAPDPAAVLAAAEQAATATRDAYAASGAIAEADAAIAAWLQLGAIHHDAGRWEDSINACEEARVVAAELQRRGTDRRRVLIDCLRGLARANAGAGWPDTAAEQSMQAAAYANQLVIESPDDLTLARLRGDVMFETGMLRKTIGRTEAARSRLQEAEAAYAYVLLEHPADAGARVGLEAARAALAELPPPPPPDPEDG